MRILICAGEASGDIHAAAVIREVQKQKPGTLFHGIAGENMNRAGCQELVPIDQLNVMGLTDVFTALPRIHRAEKLIVEWVKAHQPDVAILVDYPGFHMHLGVRLRRLGIPVLQYIAPKLWSWGGWRARRLARSQDRLACILPFESEWFFQRGITAEYVGNPTAETSQGGWARDELCRRYALKSDKPILALLPGSRPGEIQRHVPIMAEVVDGARMLLPEVQVVVPRAPGVHESSLRHLTDMHVVPIDRMTEGYALRVDAAAAVSGTATLELALWDVPTVLIYRSTALTIAIARMLANVDCIGLANILLGQRAVMPELIQNDCTPENILTHLVPLLRNEAEARHQRRAFIELRQILGGKHAASEVARIAISLAKKS